MHQSAYRMYRATLFLGAVFGSGVRQHATAQESTTQLAIAQALRSPDTVGVRAAIGDMLQVPVAEQGAELRAAVVDVLLRQREGNTSLRDGHVVAALADVALDIAQAGDPVAIPALAAFPVFGWRISWALVSLGEPALRAVLEAASPPPIDEGRVSGALTTLAMFVNEWGPEAFDEHTYAEMKGLAAHYLQGPTYWTILGRAIELAIQLEDPDLRSQVEELAASDDAVRAHGIEEAYDIGKIRERATERLADPTPWWREYLCEVKQCTPGIGASPATTTPMHTSNHQDRR